MKAKKIITGVIQGLLSLSLLMAGVMKMITPYDELVTQMAWAESFSAFAVYGIGALEVLGVIGMNLPFLLRKYKKLVPLAAGGLALTMLGAVVTHAVRGENVVAPIVLFVLASFVTYVRFELIKKNDFHTSIH